MVETTPEDRSDDGQMRSFDILDEDATSELFDTGFDLWGRKIEWFEKWYEVVVLERCSECLRYCMYLQQICMSTFMNTTDEYTLTLCFAQKRHLEKKAKHNFLRS